MFFFSSGAGAVIRWLRGVRRTPRGRSLPRLRNGRQPRRLSGVPQFDAGRTTISLRTPRTRSAKANALSCLHSIARPLAQVARALRKVDGSPLPASLDHESRPAGTNGPATGEDTLAANPFLERDASIASGHLVGTGGRQCATRSPESRIRSAPRTADTAGPAGRGHPAHGGALRARPDVEATPCSGRAHRHGRARRLWR